MAAEIRSRRLLRKFDGMFGAIIVIINITSAELLLLLSCGAFKAVANGSIDTHSPKGLSTADSFLIVHCYV